MKNKARRRKNTLKIKFKKKWKDKENMTLSINEGIKEVFSEFDYI